MSEQPERLVSKAEKATRKIGTISTGRVNYPTGCKFYMGYQKACGGNKHSGPSGKKTGKWYQASFKSKAGKVK